MSHFSLRVKVVIASFCNNDLVNCCLMNVDICVLIY